MNCKPGDLAIVVKSWAGNEGKVVTCIRLATFAELQKTEMDPSLGPLWLVDKLLNGTFGEPEPYVFDCQLKPIRPNDGEDEMIRIAGKPHDQTIRDQETA